MFSETKEFYELREHFERTHKDERLDREDKSLYKHQAYYCDGKVNTLFVAFMNGYMYAKCLYQ